MNTFETVRRAYNRCKLEEPLDWDDEKLGHMLVQTGRPRDRAEAKRHVRPARADAERLGLPDAADIAAWQREHGLT